MPTVTIKGRAYDVRVWSTGVHAYILTGKRGAVLDVYRDRSSPTGAMHVRHSDSRRLLSGVSLYDTDGILTVEEK